MLKLILGLQSVILVALVGLGYGYLNLKTQISNVKPELGASNFPVATAAPNSAELSSELKSYVDGKVVDLTKQIDEKKCDCTSTTQTVTEKSTAKQTSYISMGDAYTSKSTDWVDVPGGGVYIDLANDYSSTAAVTWSVSLKVANSNGQAFARIYDATNKIAVVGSELSTVNNADYSQVTSSDLALWRGKNLYKIQVKSLNGFEVTESGGRIKISY